MGKFEFAIFQLTLFENFASQRVLQRCPNENGGNIEMLSRSCL